MTVPEDALIETAAAMAEGWIEDDDTERARQRSLGIVLAGVGRTLATDAVAVIGDRFVQPPTMAQATVGGQAAGVAQALGVEVDSPLEGGDGAFGQVGGAAWSTLTRHLNAPRTSTTPLSAWDAPGVFAAAAGPGPGGAAATGWETFGLGDESLSIPHPAGRGLELALDAVWGAGVRRRGKVRRAIFISGAPIFSAWLATGTAWASWALTAPMRQRCMPCRSGGYGRRCTSGGYRGRKSCRRVRSSFL